MSAFTVHKNDHTGKCVLSYPAEVVTRDATSICVRAIFQQKTRDLGYVTLKTGDIFTEWFYTDRWYNVFKIEDVDNGAFKGYYCNLTRPATLTADSVAADDLELDIFIQPDSTLFTLDQDEFEALPLSNMERQQVTEAVKSIKAFVAAKVSPFDAL